MKTRWGVGFGPRDCSDYSSGVSIIPIQRLTDADRKWMLTAEYGGTGGKPLEGGMVLEEPDIEIGAGVSSKGKFVSILSQILTFQLSPVACRLIVAAMLNVAATAVVDPFEKEGEMMVALGTAQAPMQPVFRALQEMHLTRQQHQWRGYQVSRREFAYGIKCI